MRRLLHWLLVLLIIGALVFVMRIAGDEGTAAFVALLLCPNGGQLERAVAPMRVSGTGVNFTCVYGSERFDAGLQFILFALVIIFTPVAILLISLRTRRAQRPSEE